MLMLRFCCAKSPREHGTRVKVVFREHGPT